MCLFLPPFSFTRSIIFLACLSWNITLVIGLVARMKCGRRWKEHTLSCKGGASALSPNKRGIPGLHGKEWPFSTRSEESQDSADSRFSGASIQIFPSHVSMSHSFPVRALTLLKQTCLGWNFNFFETLLFLRLSPQPSSELCPSA